MFFRFERFVTLMNDLARSKIYGYVLRVSISDRARAFRTHKQLKHEVRYDFAFSISCYSRQTLWFIAMSLIRSHRRRRQRSQSKVRGTWPTEAAAREKLEAAAREKLEAAAREKLRARTPHCLVELKIFALFQSLPPAKWLTLESF